MHVCMVFRGQARNEQISTEKMIEDFSRRMMLIRHLSRCAMNNNTAASIDGHLLSALLAMGR